MASNLYTIQELNRLFDIVADPDTVLQKLGRSRADLRALESDDEIAQALETRRNAVTAIPWRIEPSQTEASDWLTKELTPHMDKLLRMVWYAVPYGMSWTRLIYRSVVGGSTIDGLADVVDLPFEWFDFKRGTGWRISIPGGERQKQLTGEETRFLYISSIRNESWRNPYGESLLSRAYWPWFFRHNTWNFWMQTLERFGTPLLIGKGVNQQQLAENLARVVQDAVIAVGMSDDVEAISPANVGSAFAEVERAIVRRIEKLILGQTLTSDVGSSGSFAMARVHNEVRKDIRDADYFMIAKTIQKIIDAMVFLKYGEVAEIPKFVPVIDVGLGQDRAIRDSALADSGILKLTEQYLLDRYDFLPGDFTVPVESEIKQRSAKASFDGGKASFDGDFALYGERFAANPLSQKDKPGQMRVDQLVDKKQITSVTTEQLTEIVNLAESPEDLEARLISLVQGEMKKDSTEFRDLFEQALFVAGVVGYVSSIEENV